jgi:hypothetical protein
MHEEGVLRQVDPAAANLRIIIVRANFAASDNSRSVAFTTGNRNRLPFCTAPRHPADRGPGRRHTGYPRQRSPSRRKR